MASARALPEAFVWWLWQGRRARAPLRTTDRRLLDVIYPGRRWGNWGPDFRDAVIALDGSVVRGDVEVHVRASDWRTHGHAANPDYTATILHVVLDAVPPNWAEQRFATVSLRDQLTEPLDRLLAEWREQPHRSTSAVCQTAEEAADLLDRAGLARLDAKAARFEGDLAALGARHALLRGASECLGYAANVAPMRALLDRAPPPAIEDLVRVEGATRAASILFGVAGLLPSQRGRLPPDGYSLDAERQWRSLAWPQPVTGLGWRWIGNRPANTPVRRVAALAALFSECPSDLESGIMTTIGELPPRRVGPALRALFERKGGAYWRRYSDFGRVMRSESALIGPQRAADIVVNAALPWALAFARMRNDRSLEQAVVGAFAAHSLLADNQITRHMAFQVLGTLSAAVVVGSACRQQGLMLLYNGWCAGRECLGCPAHVPAPH